MHKSHSRKNLACAAFILLMILCNTHLLRGLTPSWSLFRLEEVLQGQWWRIITHPFTHVSFYHLVIDLSAASLLLSQLRSSATVSRPLLFAICSVSSLLAVVFFSPDLPESGYCGLSGTAHGLMSFLGMHWLHNSKKDKANKHISRISGILFLVSSAGKSIFEVMTGEVLFASLHMGELGIPLVHAHLGGAVGGILSYLSLRIPPTGRKQTQLCEALCTSEDKKLPTKVF